MLPRPTLRDVAALAGVSVGTASKALNDRGTLSVETRERVKAAARELGFENNLTAANLRRGRTLTVALLSTDSFGRFSIPLIRGIEDALGAGEIAVFLCDARDDPIRERYYVRSMLARRVDGFVVTGRRTDPRRPITDEPLPVPVVYAYAQSQRETDRSVIPDDRGGGHLAAAHLLATGRRRVAHISGPARFQAVRERAAGMRDALREAGIEPVDEGVLFGDWSEAWGREATSYLLQVKPPIDAIFCGSDQIARGVADELRERGVRVPDDVAIVGYDNWEIIASNTRPPLTTIDMDLEGLGREAAHELLDRLQGGHAEGVRRHPCILVRRASTPAPAVSATPLPAALDVER
jgi:LacI family transcriptional regulator